MLDALCVSPGEDSSGGGRPDSPESHDAYLLQQRRARAYSKRRRVSFQESVETDAATCEVLQSAPAIDDGVKSSNGTRVLELSIEVEPKTSFEQKMILSPTHGGA
jgi:hypothetical protein